MRFHWFHLMPYPDLPDDFKSKYRSVWVDVPSELYDPEKGHRIYHEYLDQLEFADSLGFDGICVNEHHQNAYGLMPSPNLMGAALARRTSNAALVVMGNSIALYNPPGTGGGRICHARCDERRSSDRRFSRGHLDGHQFLLWPAAGGVAGKIR